VGIWVRKLSETCVFLRDKQQVIVALALASTKLLFVP